jgi:predicted transposase YbfD/YdcC
MEVNFPHAETIICVRRKSSAYKDPNAELSYYVSSIPADRYTPEQWLNLTREHWGGIEIRNHWRKDACLFEDHTRSKNPNIVAAMAMLRNCSLFFLQHDKRTSNINAFTEKIAADNKLAFQIITGKL